MNIVELNQGVQNNIDKFGLSVRHILAEADLPPFSYSIGLFKSYGHPEIIIIGLKQELAHVLINNMAYDIKEGKVFVPFEYTADVLDNFNCYLIEAEKLNYDEYVGGAQQYYEGDGFPLLQCIYPTVSGIFPWEKEWPEDIKNLQPILGPLNKI